MRSQTLNISRYSNGTLVKIQTTGTRFVSYDYVPETGAGTFTPSSVTLTATFSGGVGLGAWQYMDGTEWKPVVNGEHGFTMNGNVLSVSADSDLFTETNAVLNVRCNGNDGEHWDTVTLVREISPIELYRKNSTDIKQTDDKIALIASTEELKKYTTGKTMSHALSSLELTSSEFRTTVQREYSTKTYAEEQASAAETSAKDYTTNRLKSYSTISQTDTAIQTAVSTKTDAAQVESIIRQEADSIRLKADKIAWDSTNSSMTEDGVLTCSGANVSGDLTIEKVGGSTYFKDLTIQNYTGAGTATPKDVTGLVIDGGEYYRENFKAIIPWEYGGVLEQTIYNKPRQRAYSLNEMYGSTGFAYEQRHATFSDGEYLVINQLSKVDVSYFYDLGTGSGIRVAKGVDTNGDLYYEIRQIIGSASPNAVSFVMEANEWKFIGDALKLNGRNVQTASSSSRRYKKEIAPISEELDPRRLYALEVKQFRYKDDVPLQYADMAGQTIPGLIAEDVEEIYPSAVIHDKDGNVESWDERRLLPPMLSLIQEQHAEIERLRNEIATIKKELGGLKNEIYR